MESVVILTAAIDCGRMLRKRTLGTFFCDKNIDRQTYRQLNSRSNPIIMEGMSNNTMEITIYPKTQPELSITSLRFLF